MLKHTRHSVRLYFAKLEYEEEDEEEKILVYKFNIFYSSFLLRSKNLC